MYIIDENMKKWKLEIIDDNGIDWTEDFVQDDNIVWCDESHCYKSDIETIKWWIAAIEIQTENPEFHMERIICEIEFKKR